MLVTGTTAVRSWERNGLAAWLPPLVGATSFVMYVFTMFPGLAGIGDSPKFQYVGAVLGTPHAPGYPVYITLSWLFSQLPVGTIAYRVNLLSGVFGAAAVALMTLLLRRLGCGPVASTAVALAFAFGQVFWSQAIIAEVYTVNAVLFLGMWLALVAWRQQRRDRDLLLATVWYAFGLAHHPTMWMTAPAVAVFVLLVDAGVLRRPRLLLSVAAILAAGLSLYGLIWLRTIQQAPFLEAKATSVGDIVSLLRGDQFDEWLFLYTWREVLTERIPLVAGWIGSELQVAGLVLAGTGLALLFRSQRALALALVIVALTISSFTLQHSAFDLQVFLILPMMALWIAAGVGLQWWLGRVRGWLPAPAVRYSWAVALVAFALPAALAASNFEVNNQREHTFEAEYFAALFEVLPDKSAIIDEDYIITAMVNYKIIGEKAGNGPHLVVIPPDRRIAREYEAAGFQIYAFHQGRLKLEAQWITLEPVEWKLPFPRHGRHVYDADIEPIVTRLYRVVRFDHG